MTETLLSLVSGEVASLIVLIAYVLSHVVQYLPVTWTEKVPDIVMTVINLLAAKHGAEASAQTDIKGNLMEPTDEQFIYPYANTERSDGCY